MGIGREKIYTLAYADDLVLLTESEKEMNEMLRVLERYSDKLKLTLSVPKSKILIFKKGRGKKTKEEWKWKGETVEEVKEFKYLGFVYRPDKHIQEVKRKAVAAIRQVWYIGKKLFYENVERRMKLFDQMVKGILYYNII